MSYETIQLEMRDAVCVLTLNRPDRLNALNVQVAHDFKAAVKEALERGARATDRDGKGKQVREAATSDWIRTLLPS